MDISIYNGTRQKISGSALRYAADKFGREMNMARRSVSVALVGERRIRELNRRYRGLNKVTDILSFAQRKGAYLGELVICYQQVKRQAKRRRVSASSELVFIFIHGLLHLAGYNDDTLSGWREMERIGTRLCKSLHR